MKKILVVSDNVELVSHFKLVESDVLLDIAKLDYCYSVINKSPGELSKLGMTVINMKAQDNIASIISDYDLVISAHCKQIFPSNLVNNVRCINVHPGLNPYNRGWYPQVFSIMNKKPIGCTIHLMDAEIDHGEVIYQSEVKVNSWDTSLDVYQRVIEAEKGLISEHLLNLVNEDYKCNKLEFDGNYNGIVQFTNLTNLNMDSTGSLAEHIDLLRALTHGNFNNAYFTDDKGNKVFVKLSLEQEN